MSTIKTFKGQLPVGNEKKIHLSTADGLTGYKIKEFRVVSKQPGAGNYEIIGKVRLTPDNNISSEVDFNDTDLMALSLYQDAAGNLNFADTMIIDKEIFNQDVFVNVTDASGNTTPINFYLELEQIKINLNTSTYHTLKNLRSNQQN